jgi:hypothetical protein
MSRMGRQHPLIRRTIAFLLLLMAPYIAGAALADEPIGVFANSNTNCIQLIDPIILKP